MLETVGIVGSVCLALCGVPLVLEAWRTGKCSYAWWFLILWIVGEAATLIYTGFRGEWILWLNYIPNLLCLIILFFYNQNSE